MTDLSEDLKKIKLPKETLDEISHIGDKEVKEKLFLSEEEFKLLENPAFDLKEHRRKKNEPNEELLEVYRNVVDILKKYLDLKEEYYNLIALWIIGTYFHEQFPSYPYLFINAMKGSGKTRLLKIITCLSKNGEMLNSLTEAVLFRTKGTLAIDEFEGIERKGKENLRELLNSAYKRGTKVKRMKQKKTDKGVEQVVEEFEVYRPICLANITGMEGVLGDRCITLVLERSSNKKITNLVEIFEEENIVKKTKKLFGKCSLCSLCTPMGTYREWNNYVTNNYTNYTNNTNNTNYTNNTQLFEMLKFAGIEGRELELAFPLLFVATFISSGILKKTTLTLIRLFSERKEEEFNENLDISLIDFVSQFSEDSGFNFLHRLVNEFKVFVQSNDEDINEKWMGRALKRLNLIKDKRRLSRGVEVTLNVKKAQEKIRMFN